MLRSCSYYSFLIDSCDGISFFLFENKANAKYAKIINQLLNSEIFWILK